jgi:hypothetical protein
MRAGWVAQLATENAGECDFRIFQVAGRLRRGFRPLQDEPGEVKPGQYVGAGAQVRCEMRFDDEAEEKGDGLTRQQRRGGR